jgi:hypothetical protein
MNKKVIFFVTCALICGGIVFSGCDPAETDSETDCTPVDNSVIELTSDLGGKTLYVGDTVAITWKADGNQITHGSVQVDVSIDNFMTTSAIPESSLSTQPGSQCMTTRWIIGKESQIVDYQSVNNQCMIRVHEYESFENGTSSQVFTIRKR